MEEYRFSGGVCAQGLVICAPVKMLIHMNMEELMTVGRLHLQSGDNEEALRLFEEAIGKEPQNAIAWGGKGIALINLGKYQEAIDCFDKAIQLDPITAFAWEGKGVALMRLERYEDAIPYFDMALEISPHFQRALENRTLALKKMGKSESD
jgi:tetratricopeptide (TPR) repeat protein